MNLRWLSIVSVAAALAVSACSSSHSAGSHNEDQSKTTDTGDAFNDADVSFAQGMIPHHQQAIEMAEIALDLKVGASDAVRELAERIKGGQDPEIAMMTAWLKGWGQSMQMDTSNGHGMEPMDGMMSTEDMASLKMMTGAEFDAMWLSMMIRHHEGAIAMAQTVKADGSTADVLSLADRIIAAQEGEIAEMKALLGS